MKDTRLTFNSASLGDREPAGSKRPSPLRERMLRAGIWTAGGFAAQRAFQLASNLLLTRLLMPEAFGLMALANVFMIGLAMFSDVGIKPAVIQSPRGEDPLFLNTAWTLQVIRGFTLWGGAALIAYPASLIYGHAILWPLITMLGATAAISGFSSISLAVSERRLLVKQLTLVQLAGQVLALALTALLVWQFRSIWALAVGSLTGSLVSAVLSHIFLPPHHHKLELDKTATASLVRFGRWIFISTALTFAAGQGLRMVQGLLLTPAQLGVLSIAQTIAAMPTELTSQIASLAIFPALAEARQNGQQRMVEVLHAVQPKILALSILSFAALALVAIPLIGLLYDVRYHLAGPQLVLLALSGAIAIVAMPYQNAIFAMGNTRLMATFNGVSALARMLCMLVGHGLGGTPGMLAGIAVGSFLSYFVVAIYAARYRLLSLKTDAVCFGAIAAIAVLSLSVYGRVIWAFN